MALHMIPGSMLLMLLAAVFPFATPLAPVRVTFLTDCQMYSDWQSLGMIFSFKMSGQPGKVTRVMCCSDEKMKKYNPQLLNFSETHVAPDMTIHPRLKDHYAAYNKPEAVISYMDHVVPDEEYVLVLDSDMILRRPFLIEEMKPTKGLAVGARYTYMIGVNNELAVRHIPEIAPRNDTLAGPYGRRADQVGGFFFMHREDLKRMSHDWLRYTEDVRFDDQAYRLSGDVYATTPGAKPWISEMYGYAFGAAKNGVWHRWDSDSMIYPAYEPHVMPKLMHYGLYFEFTTAAGRKYSFDKHQHYNFDANACPPWDLTLQSRTGGVFDWPPRPSDLTPWDVNKKGSLTVHYRDLLSMETICTLNAAMCDYHLSHCPPSEQLVTVCTEAFERYHEVAAATTAVEKMMGCMDFDSRCAEWKGLGECTKNQGYMSETCRKTCDACNPPGPAESIQPPKQAPGESILVEMAQKLKSQAEGDKRGAEQVIAVATQSPPATISASPASLRVPDEAGAGPVPKTVVHHGAPERVIVPHRTEPAKADVKKVRTRPPRAAVVYTGAHGSTKDLLTHCYRLGLTVSEVKDCAKAAKMGMKYLQPDVAEGDDADSLGEPLATSTTEDQGKGALRDLDDLTLTQGEGRHKVVKPPREVGYWGRMLRSLTAYEGAGLCLVAVALLAMLLPRITAAWRARSRRGRSRDTRSE